MKLGITLRETNVDNVIRIRDLGLIDFIEIVPSFYFRYNKISILKDLLNRVELPYTFHFVDHSPLSFQLNTDRIRQTSEMIKHFSPEIISDHLTSCEEGFSVDMNVPIPLSSEVIDHYIKNVLTLRNIIADGSNAEFIMEHVPRYFQYKSDDMNLEYFLNLVAKETDTGILLDLHNLQCDQVNIEQPMAKTISSIDQSRIKEVHIAGGEILEGKLRYDSHSGNPDSDQLEMLHHLNIKNMYVNLEREHNFDTDEVIQCLKLLQGLRR